MSNDDIEWLKPDELTAWVGLIKLSSRIVSLTDGALRQTAGITGRDYELLHHLSTVPSGWRINELAGVIDDSSSCITHRINRLCEAGLVAKRVDPTDQRARRVHLTSAGRRLLERTAPTHVARVRRWVIDPLNRNDLAQLIRLANKLNMHLAKTEPANG